MMFPGLLGSIRVARIYVVDIIRIYKVIPTSIVVLKGGMGQTATEILCLPTYKPPLPLNVFDTILVNIYSFDRAYSSSSGCSDIMHN